jgi:hypothetical protein
MSAERCDCGYSFVAGAVPPDVNVPNQKAHNSRKKFWGITLGVAIGVAILYSVSQPTRPAQEGDAKAPGQAASPDASAVADRVSQADWLSQDALRKTRLWPANATVGSIAYQIAREHGWNQNVNGECALPTPAELEQRDESDISFLSNLIMAACGPRASLRTTDKTIGIVVSSNPRVDTIPENIRREIYIRRSKAETQAEKATTNMDDESGSKLSDKLISSAMRPDKVKYHLSDEDLRDISSEGMWKNWPAETAEEIKAQQDEQLVKAGCREIYKATSDKAIRDLTVNEARQVDACEELGLYK